MTTSPARPKAQIIVREAIAAEREQVADVIQKAYAQFEAQYDARHWRDYEASTRKTILEQADAVRIVAVVNDRIAAAVLFCQPYERLMGSRLVKNPYPEFRLLGVDPDFRDLGIGAILIEHCEKMAREGNFEYLSLHTTEVMATAKNMYERRGYSRFTAIDFSPAPDFVVMGYKKRLSND